MLAFENGPESATVSRPRVPTPSSTATLEAEALGRALSRAATVLRGHDPACGIAPLVLLADVATPGAAAADRAACVDDFLDAVTTYVRALRAAGTPPELVVVAVKRQMQLALGAHADPRRVSAWLAHAVTWGIEEYFRG